MKKNIKYIIVVFLLMVGCFITQKKVYANDFYAELAGKIKTIYVVDRENGVRSNIDYISIDGEYVYCIEPYKIVLNGDVVIPQSMLSEEMKEKISIIAHFGYSSSKQSDQWYAATQILIWETLGYHQDVYGFDDYPRYRSQILADVESYSRLPSFHQQTFLLEKDETLVLEDQHSVLSSFEKISVNSTAVELKQNGNSLHIKGKSNKKQVIDISFKRFDDQNLGLAIVYVGKNSDVQALIKAKIQNNKEGKCRIYLQPYGYVRLKKLANIPFGIETTSTAYGLLHRLVYAQAYLPETTIHIYAKEPIYNGKGDLLYAKDEMVESMTSTMSQLNRKKLYSGKYYAKEVKTPDAYVLNTRIYEFEIKEDEEAIITTDMRLNNELSRVDIKLKKRLERHFLIDKNAYRDVVFGIYTAEDIQDSISKVSLPKNTLVHLSEITKKGHLKEQAQLPFGKYYVKEVSTHSDYEPNETVYNFHVYGKNEEVISIDLGKINNRLKRSKLHIKKMDKQSGAPLIATFVLYDKDMRILDQFTTTEEETMLEGLVNGVYYVEEVVAPEGYAIDSTRHQVTVNGKDETLTIANQKVVKAGDLSKSKTIAYDVLASLSVLFFLGKRVLIKS